MPHQFYLLLLCLCSLACSNQPAPKPPPKEYVSEEKVEKIDAEPVERPQPGIKVQFEVYQFDTTFEASNPHEGKSKKVRSWSEVDQFFPVFRFSKEQLGIAIEIDNGGHYPFTDSLFSSFIKRAKVQEEEKSFVFKKSKKLDELFFKNDTTSSFYIYCTKGVTRSAITGILYSYSYCEALFMVELAEIDTTQFGQPLIASKQFLDLKYAPLPAFQKDLLAVNAYWSSQSDYEDETLPVQFAYNQDYFLVYDDDLRWYYDKTSACLFPTRRIFKLERGNKVRLKWGNGLDLFGIACD